LANNRSTDQHTIISRGLDNRNTPDKTRRGYAESMYNMDTNTSGYIEKRKGYQFSRDIPIRATTVNVADDEVELAVSNSIDASLITSGPVIISQYTASGSKSFYYQEFENLSNFTIEGIDDIEVVHTRGLDVAIDLLQQDLTRTVFVESVLPDSILNTDNGDGTFTTTFGFPDYTINDLFTPIVPDDSVLETAWSKTTFDFVTSDGTQLTPDDATSPVGSVTISGDVCSISVVLDEQPDFEVPYSNYIIRFMKNTGSGQEVIIEDFSSVSLSGVTRTLNLSFTDSGMSPTDSYTILLYSIDGVVDGSATIIQDIIPVVDETDPNDQVIELTGVTNRYNITDLFEINTVTGEQSRVIPNSVSYNAASSTLTCTYSMDDAENTEVKFVRFPATPIVTGISVTNPAVDAWSSDLGTEETDMNLSASNTSGTWIYGFSQSEVLSVGNAEQYREVKKIDEWAGQTLNKILAVCQGDIWYDSPKVENYQYFPETSVALNDVQGSNTQTVGAFFGNVQDTGKTRGVIAENIEDGEIEITSITNNKDQTITVNFDLGTVTEGSADSVVVNYDKLIISNCEVNDYNGEWIITAATSSSYTISIPNLPEFKRSLTISSGTKATIQTDFVTLSDTPSAEIGDRVNFLSGSSVYSIDNSSNIIWIDNVTSTTTIQAAVPVSYTRTTNLIPLRDINWIVPSDLLIIKGYERKFKVVNVNTTSSTITIDEAIEVTGQAGQLTTVQLDGRLMLSRVPENNTKLDSQTFADTKAEYKVTSGKLSSSVFLSNNEEQIQKFDGDSVVDAGLLNWPIRNNTWLSEVIDGDPEKGLLPISFSFADSTIASGTATCTFVAGMPDLSSLPSVGDRIDIKKDASPSPKYYSGTFASYDAELNQIVLEDVTQLGGSAAPDDPSMSGVLYVPTKFKYYMRLESVDKNRQISSGPTTGIDETIVTIYRPTVINHKATVFPAEAMKIDWSRLKIKLFRTYGYPVNGAEEALFRPILTRNIPTIGGTDVKDLLFSCSSILFEDVTPDSAINPESQDNVSTGLKGVNLPQSITIPPKSDYITNVGNRMIYANVKSSPQIAVGFEDLSGYTLTSNDYARTAICLTKIIGSVTWRSGGDQRLVFYNVPNNTGEKLQVDGSDLIASAVLPISGITGGVDSGNYYMDLEFDDSTLFSQYADWDNNLLDFVQLIGTGSLSRYGELVGHHRVSVATSSGASSLVRIYVSKQVYDRLQGGSWNYDADAMSVVIACGISGGNYKPVGYNNIAVVPLFNRNLEDEITSDVTQISNGYGVPSNMIALDLGRAINDVMRAQDLFTKSDNLVSESDALVAAGSAMEGWGQARWGDVVGYNNLIIESFKDTVEFAVDYTSHEQEDAEENIEIFINGYSPRRVTPSTNAALEPDIDYTNSVVDITSSPAYFNSRVVMSYEGFPSIVDQPFTVNP